MKSDRIAKFAVIALSAGALAAQLTAIPNEVKADAVTVEPSFKYTEKAEINLFDEYEKNQVEYLVWQIVDNSIDNIDDVKVSYTYDVLYSAPNQKTGYVVDFSYGDEFGYVTLLSDEVSIKPDEIVLGEKSPYYNKCGVYLYPAAGYHYILTDEGEVVEASEYSDTKSSTVQPTSVIEGGSEYGVEVKYPYYNGSLGEEYAIPKFEFGYKYYKDMHTAPKSNVCANVAGAIVLNYWNTYFDNDLLKLSSDDIYQGSKDMTHEKANKYMDTFYKYMNTNGYLGAAGLLFQMGGTIPEDCYDGFCRLITENGYVARVLESPTFEQMKLNIKTGIPIFITSFDYYFSHDIYSQPTFPLPSGNNNLSFECEHHYGIPRAHTFIGYGYKEYFLRDRNGNSTTVGLIRVADGWGSACYFHLEKSNVYDVVRIKVSRC